MSAPTAAEPGDRGRLDLRLLVPALVAWGVAAAGLAWGAPLRWACVAGCVLLVTVGLWWSGRAGARTPTARVWPTVLAFSGVLTALLLGVSTLAETSRQQGLVAEAIDREAVVTAEVTLTADARRVVSEGRFGRSELVLLRARAHRIEYRGRESAANAPLLVIARPGAGWDELTWRTRVEVTGRLEPSEPGDDVVAVLSPAKGPQQARAPGGGWRVAEGLREGLRESMDPVWADARGLVPGLVLGDTSLTPPELTDAMTETGMTHLSAVSGSNVAIVVGAVLWVCTGTGVPRRARPWAAAVALAGFVVLARPEPSVLRAGVMGAVALVGMTASRRAASLPALATSMVLLLVWDPWLARSYGFALSVLATLGLVLFVRPWAEALRRRWPRLPEPVAQALVIPVAAALTTAPVVAMLQGQVSVVGLLTNLAAAPLVAPATVGGVVVVLVHPVAEPLADAIAWVAGAPAQVIGWVARAGAAVPHGAVPWPADGRGGLVLALALALAVVSGPPLVRVLGRLVRWVRAHRAARTRPRAPAVGTGGPRPRSPGRWRDAVTACAGCAALVLVVLWAGPRLPGGVPGLGGSHAAGDWRVVMCDVGQGDAFLVRTASDRAVLVDTGPPGARTPACLRAAGVRALDAVVVSHSHADHSGNLGAVLDAVPVGAVWASPADLARPMQPGHPAEWREVARARGAPIAPFAAGDRVELGAARLTAVWPRPGAAVGPEDRRNDGSLVLHAEVGQPGGAQELGEPLRALLTGDLEVTGGAAVQALTSSLPVDLLKVPHHGSAHQGEALLARGAPLALVSAGRDNDHGHPAPVTTRRLEDAGSTVVGTVEHGDVAVGTGGPAGLWWARL
ncbi:ComEC/Rec2 family competence protein [Kytococcus sedentarius]|uniref:ComEC/Rec2 family competence protein n=1 Tax=Kytococcus sedentarius TaxID=1276 RepID=UPI0035BC5491